MPATVLYDARDGVARIVLNRPDVSNAIDLATARGFSAAVSRAVSDDLVRAILIEGAGARFCAGGDVASMTEAEDPSRHVHELAETLDGALQALSAGSKAVVVAVHGAVAGAGLAIMLTGDVVVAESSTRFLTAYAKVGLTPDCGLSWLLPRAVGHQRAADLLLTGRTLDGVEAAGWGMVSRLVNDGEAHHAAGQIARDIATGPAQSIGMARRLLIRSWNSTRAQAGAEEVSSIEWAITQVESRSRISAFIGR